MNNTSYINYLFLAIVIIYPEIQLFYLPVAGGGQVQMAMGLLAIIASFSDREFRAIITQFPVVVWMIWCVYSIFNWFLSGYESIYTGRPFTFIFLFILLPFITLIITAFELKKDMKRTIKFLCIVFGLYILLGLTSQGSLTFYNEERGEHGLGNDMPLVACTALFVAALGYSQKYFKLWVFLLFLVLSLVSSIYVAERKTFIVTFVLAFFTLIPFGYLKKPSYWLLLLLAVFLSYILVDWVAENTLIGERLAGTFDQGSQFTDNYYLSFLGDRAIQYEEGWPVFLTNPITGVGLRNYPIATHTHYQLHTEYMVQLVEGGLIGTSIFLLFALSLFKRLFNERINRICNKQSWSVCLGEFLTLFLLCFTTWTYDSPHYYIALAIILIFSIPANEMSKIKKQFYNYYNRKKL